MVEDEAYHKMLVFAVTFMLYERARSVEVEMSQVYCLRSYLKLMSQVYHFTFESFRAICTNMYAVFCLRKQQKWKQPNLDCMCCMMQLEKRTQNPQLSADPYRTWVSNQVNWLCDSRMLPAAIPTARILTFGYASEWLGKESINQRLPLVAEQLLRSITNIREDCRTRPILFIGHCFGGLVIEKATILAKLHDDDYPDMLRCIAGIVFLGTPHKGSASQSKAAIIASVASAFGKGEMTSLLKAVEKDSEMLNDLVHDFTRVVNRGAIPLFCFFEQKRTDVAKIFKPINKFLPQFKELVVDEMSGCIEGFPKLGLPLDHFQINRYSDPADGNFVSIKEEVRAFVRAAPDRVALRLNPPPIASSKSMIDNDRDLAALNALFVTDPSTDMEMIQSQKDKLLEDTGSWILSHELFTTWLNIQDNSTIWIHGSPGKGKTMLAISLIKELKARIDLEGSASTTALAYFFCDNKDSRRNTATAILRGIIYQLLCQKPMLCIILRDQYEKQREQLFDSPNSLQALWRIFLTISSHGSLSKIFLVVDALDECEAESTEMFLALLEPYINATPGNDTQIPEASTSGKASHQMKWLLTSRNELLIQQRLTGCINLSLEANRAEVESSVNRFIDVKVEQLQKWKRYDSTLRQFIKDTLQEKSEGTFLWVALACRELAKPTVLSINTKKVLLKLPSGLVQLYERILEQVLSFEDEEFAENVKGILRTMVIALRPLALLELGVAAKLPEEHRGNIAQIKEYLMVCESLVIIRDNIAYFVHQTAKTFILTNAIGQVLSMDISEDHQFIGLNCFSHISRTPAREEGEFSNATCDEAKHVDLDYPTLFWTEHVRRSPATIAEHFDIQSEFFFSVSIYRQAWLDEYWPKKHAKYEAKPGKFSALHLMAYAGLTPLLRRFLSNAEAGNINAPDSLGNTPLVWAARNGFDSTVLLLTSYGADVTLKNKEGMTALHWAAGNGHQAIVKHLHGIKADIETTDKGGWTPLHRAAYNGHAHIVKLLIELGSDVEALDGSTWTAMHRAASMGQTDVVRLLIKQKASMSMLDREGMTPMLHASWAGQHDIICIFLEFGIDVNEKDYNKWTALHNAAWNGHLDTVKLLLKSGANANVGNAYNSTALHNAVWSGHDEIVGLLLEAEADVDAKAHDERETPLQQAAWRGHLSCVQLLLEKEADVNMQNVAGHTALHHAASNGHDKVTLLLLEYGADLRIVDKHGQTANALAEANGHSTTASILKEKELEANTYSSGTLTLVDLPLVDINVAEALGIDPRSSTVEPHQAPGFFVPEKITANVYGKKKYFYMKSGENQEMFESEYISLTRLHEAVPTFAPQPLAWGKFASSDKYYLVTEWIDEDAAEADTGLRMGQSLAQKVAKLHNAPVPIPSGYAKIMFGFPIQTYCGSTPQKNDWMSSWADFYGECRLRHICRLIEENHGTDEELNELLEKLISVVVPRLLGEGRLGGLARIKPVLIHGDLWEGNRSKGKFDYGDVIEPVTYDPSCVYAHSEFELCLMRMFGGFSAGFFIEYHHLVPKTEPKKEYDDRMDLYELYHFLNHYAIYSGGYRDDAIRCMKKLCNKYAE
ncbi:hypothetical protein VE04_04045 [Pseudogymnoascus sp. 24MN13]|nr:hypothetical protein VE04_04045 [Pseudogymnoascus sp. 24MN13]